MRRNPLDKVLASFTLGALLFNLSTVSALETPPSFDLAFHPGQGSAEGNGVASDTNGNIYVTGQYSGSATIAGVSLSGHGSEDYFLASFDSSGNARWGLGAGTSGSDYGTSVKIAPNGDLVVSLSMFMPATIHGTNFTGFGGRDAVVARYTSAGALLWARVVGGAANDEGDDVAVDSNGNVIFAGRIRGTATVGTNVFGTADTNTICQFIAKFDANGTPTWAKAVTTKTEATGTAVAVDTNDNIYYAGQDVIASDRYVKVTKYDSNGQSVWSTNYLGSSSGTVATGIGVDSSNNVYVAGTFSGGSITFGSTTLETPNFALRGFLVKHDANGNPLWADRIGGRAYRVAVAPDGSAYSAGFFLASSANFGSTTLTNMSSNDGFVCKHSSDGQLAWLHHVADSSGFVEILRSITVNTSGVVHVVGEATTGAFDLESYPRSGQVAVARIATNYLHKFTLTRTVSPSASGSVIPTPQSYANNRYFSNAVVQLRASPGFNRAFAGWSGALSGTENPTTIVMDSDKTVTAIFTNLPVRYTLTTNVAPSGSGSIVVNPSSTNGYDPNTVVELTAVPASGNVFSGWSGSVTGTQNPINLTMDAAKTVTANFTATTTNPTTFLLARGVSPGGSGFITVNPGSTNNSYPSNTVVALTATPNSGFRFLRWSGASSSTNRSVNIVMNTNKTIQALFTNLPKYKLTATVNPPTAGSITLSPFAPTNMYNAGTVVTLTATPNGTNRFAAWFGGVSGVTNRISTTMNANKTATALFNNRGSFVFQNPAGQTAVWFMQNTQRITSVLLNNGLSAGLNWRLAGAADFDRNGSSDLLFRGTNGQVMVWRMSGNIPTNTFLLRNGAVWNTSWRVAAAADFNTDSKSDILWQNTNGVLNVWLMNGLTYSTNRNLPYLTGGFHARAAANLDTNNSPDIVLQNSSGQVQAWLMTGMTRTATRMLNNSISPGTAWIVAGATDLNGDRKADIIFRRSDGAILVWFMNGTTFVRSVVLPATIAPPWVLQAVK